MKTMTTDHTPKIAIYPGTFDPLTLGHEDIIRRAARMFDHVVLGVAESLGKKPIFARDERMDVAREALADLSNVSVVGFGGLLVHFASAHRAMVVVRGVRSVTDFDYEFQMAGMNRQMKPELETIFMTPSEAQQYVSGTLVREIARMGGDIERFVGPTVARRLRAKLQTS
jgi:pantetheine-phosphate adenylyltransferase